MLPPSPLARQVYLGLVRALIDRVRNAGRTELTPDESEALFACLHMFVAPIPAPADQVDYYENNVPMAIHVRQDPKFGPYVCFGIGGRQALLSSNDDGVDLPPLNGYLARQLIQRSTLWRRALSRQLSQAAFESMQEVLERISDLICCIPDLHTLDIDYVFFRGSQLLACSFCLRLIEYPVARLPRVPGT